MKKEAEIMPLEIGERIIAKQFRHPMNTEEFMVLYREKSFRCALHELVNAHSRNAELREDMLQEGWLVISQSPPGMEREFYLREAGKAIHKCHMKERRHAELFQENSQAKKVRNRDRMRLARAGKRIKIILRPGVKRGFCA